MPTSFGTAAHPPGEYMIRDDLTPSAMKRSNSILSFGSRSNASTRQIFGSILPISNVTEKPKSKFPNLLIQRLYCLVFVWTLLSLVIVSLMFLGRHDIGLADVVSGHLPDAIAVVDNNPKTPI